MAARCLLLNNDRAKRIRSFHSRDPIWRVMNYYIAFVGKVREFSFEFNTLADTILWYAFRWYVCLCVCIYKPLVHLRTNENIPTPSELISRLTIMLVNSSLDILCSFRGFNPFYLLLWWRKLLEYQIARVIYLCVLNYAACIHKCWQLCLVKHCNRQAEYSSSKDWFRNRIQIEMPSTVYIGHVLVGIWDRTFGHLFSSRSSLVDLFVPLSCCWFIVVHILLVVTFSTVYAISWRLCIPTDSSHLFLMSLVCMEYV